MSKTMETYQQFIDSIFNSNAEQFVIFNGKEIKTLCTVESANKEIDKLQQRINKAIEYINDNFKEDDAVGYLVSKDHIEELLKILRG